jgi:hypothetical protein
MFRRDLRGWQKKSPVVFGFLIFIPPSSKSRLKSAVASVFLRVRNSSRRRALFVVIWTCLQPDLQIIPKAFPENSCAETGGLVMIEK